MRMSSHTLSHSWVEYVPRHWLSIIWVECTYIFNHLPSHLSRMCISSHTLSHSWVEYVPRQWRSIIWGSNAYCFNRQIRTSCFLGVAPIYIYIGSHVYLFFPSRNKVIHGFSTAVSPAFFLAQSNLIWRFSSSEKLRALRMPFSKKDLWIWKKDS